MPRNNIYSKVTAAIFTAMCEEMAYFENHFSNCKSEVIKIGEFAFKLYLYNNNYILLAYTGLGTAFAASAVTLIHQQFSPEYIFLCGTAGGISTNAKLRDVIVVKQAFEAEIQGAFKILKGTPFESCLTHPHKNQIFPASYCANEELLKLSENLINNNSSVHYGTVVSSNAFPAPLELFQQVKSMDPYSIDMETSAFYQIAWLLNIKALAVRGISNVLNHDGTDEAVAQSDVKGSAEAAAKVLIQVINKLLLQLCNEEKSTYSVNNKEANLLIKKFNLEPHPEGGFYRRTYESSHTVKPLDSRYGDENRFAGTSIYYLLEGKDFSAWHRLKSDEMWHFYKGSSIKIYVLDKSGKLNTYLLGDPFEIDNASFQVVVKAGDWFAAELLNKSSYTLVGCTVNPGFDFNDFELANGDELAKEFPEHTDIIKKLTRVEDGIALKVTFSK